ncbi:MAG: FkbM family methyltransferase [Gemmatimonadota bacterium]|nr:FkbM family methyltransferase [Gemmatimonadota bacterium]
MNPAIQLLKRIARPAIRRFRRLIRRRVDEPSCTCRFGDLIVHYPADSLIGQFIAAGTGWDLNLGTVVSQLVQQSTPTFVDVGSNIGASLMQMKLAKPASFVYCFEPSDRFLPYLDQNIAANGWANVTVERTVLSSHAGSMRLHTNASTASVVSREYDGHDFRFDELVRATTLDSYFGGLGSVHFIKIDTDGYDFDVLLGGSSLLRRDRPVIYFEFAPDLLKRANRHPRDFLSFLIGHGYEDFFAFSNRGEPLGVKTSVMDLGSLIQEDCPYLDLVTTHHSARAAVSVLSLRPP